MFRVCKFLLIALLSTPVLASPQDAAQSASKDQSATAQAKPVNREYSGMYAFLKEGEFVQLTIEDTGTITGFVSRYGDGASDKGAFLDQYFKSGSLDGNKLSFKTETVHGVWFDFKGSIERGDGKNPGDEGYFLMKGTLTQSSTDADKKVSARSREVALRSFPKDAEPTPDTRN